MKVTKFIIAGALLTSYELTMTMFLRPISKNILQKAYSVEATPTIQKAITQKSQCPVGKIIGGSLFLGTVITATIYTQVKIAENDFDQNKTLNSMRQDVKTLTNLMQTAGHDTQEYLNETYTHLKNKVDEISKK